MLPPSSFINSQIVAEKNIDKITKIDNKVKFLMNLIKFITTYNKKIINILFNYINHF